MTKQNEVLSHETLSIQPELRRDLTPVLLNRDHHRLVEDLKKLDEDLRSSGVESLAMRLACETSPDSGAFLRALEQALRVRRLRAARGTVTADVGCTGVCAVFGNLVHERSARRLCGCRTIDGIRWTSKSTLQRASTFFDQAQLRRLNVALVELLGGRDGTRRSVLSEPKTCPCA